MSTKTKQKIYNGITIACVLMCLILIGRVASDELTSGKVMDLHSPPAISLAESTKPEGDLPKDGIVIDQATIETELAKYIDDNFPLKDIKVDIKETGEITLSARASKSKLEEYLKDTGISIKGGRIISMFLPRKIDATFKMMCECDDESGLLLISPASFFVGDIEVDMKNMPESFFSNVSEGINKLLIASGYYFTNIGFADGAIILTS